MKYGFLLKKVRDTIIPITTIPKDENKVDEIVDILSIIHCYVPILEFLRKVFIPSLNEHVDIREARSFLIIPQEDYLTAERSSGAQQIKIKADSPSSWYEELVLARSFLIILQGDYLTI